MPARQTDVVQSPLTVQALPGAHLAVQEPPQSTSVSVPFLTTSVQVATWQVTLHTPLAQSDGAPQLLLVPHLVLQVPPQSTSLSVPFFTPSAQLGALQTLSAHTRFKQSLPPVQTAPVGHFAQALVPPQSTSTSPPFFTTSEQVGTW